MKKRGQESAAGPHCISAAAVRQALEGQEGAALADAKSDTISGKNTENQGSRTHHVPAAAVLQALHRQK